MNNKQEPPVTPQELREVVVAYPTGGTKKLHALADWLELHMPLYLEAVDLLRVQDRTRMEWYNRRSALLAKVKGE